MDINTKQSFLQLTEIVIHLEAKKLKNEFID